MKFLDQFSEGLNRLVTFAITFLLAWMTIVLVIQVGARYLLSSGMPWTEEMARFAMIWLVFLGATVMSKEGSHISITILEDRYPSIKPWLVPIQKIFGIVYLIIIAWIGMDAIQVVSAQVSANMRISMGIIYAIIPVSFIIALVHMVVDFRKKTKAAEVHTL